MTSSVLCKYCGHTWEQWFIGSYESLRCDKCKSSGKYYMLVKEDGPSVDYYAESEGGE